LRLLMSLWDEGGGSPWKPFYRGAKGWPADQGWLRGGQPMWPKPLCSVPKVWWLTKRETVRGKEKRMEKVAERSPIFGRPAMLNIHSIPTFILHFILLLSCSLH
jgi:hypothetical protein